MTALTARRRSIPTGQLLLVPASLVCGCLAGVVAFAALVLGGGPTFFALAGLAVVIALCAVYGIERVLLGVILINIPIQLDSYFDYRLEPAELGAVGGFPVSVTTLCLVLLIGRRLLLGMRYSSGHGSRPLLGFGVVLVLSAISVLNAPDIVLGAYGVFVLLHAFVLFSYLLVVIESAADVRRAVSLLLVGAVIESTVIISAQLFGVTFPAPLSVGVVEAQTRPALVERATGTFGSPNAAAGYLAVVAVLAIGAALAARRGRSRILAASAASAAAIALLLTASRGGLLAFAGGVLVVFVCGMLRRIVRHRTLFGLAAGIVCVASLFGGEALGRFVADDAGAAESRGPLLALGIEIVRSAPVLGVGTNNFVAVLPEFAGPGFSRSWLYAVHNQYVLVAAEMGLPALLALLAFLVTSLRHAWAATAKLPVDQAPLAAGCLGALAARMIHMGFDLFNTVVAWEVLIVVAALATVLNSRTDAREPSAR